MIHDITIRPQAGLPGAEDDTASVAGAVLVHNGTSYDLSGIPDGGDGIPSGAHPFASRIVRDGGTLRYELRMIVAPEMMADQTRLTDADWTVSIEDEAVPDLVERVEVSE